MFRFWTSKQSRQIDQLSVIARQCVAALCFERYCEFRGLKHPDIDAFIDHVWRVATLRNPDEFCEWESGFENLRATDWCEPVAEDFLALIPKEIRSEYFELASDVIETSAMTWYGSDLPATRKYCLKVLRTVSKYPIELPQLDCFRNSSPKWGGGWGKNPTAEELQIWRYDS